MRQLRLLALLGPALLLLPAVACEDPSSTSPQFTFEAGPGFEAGPPAEGGPIPDGGDIEAADVIVPPVPKGVSVTVTDNLVPKANVRVISQDATGAVISEGKTDATGKLKLATAPSIVTVLATSNSAPTPVSFFAVADGDDLVVRIPSLVIAEQSPTGQYTFTFTAGMQGQSPNATVYVGNGCAGGTADTSMPYTFSVYPRCLTAANAVLADGSTAGIRDGFTFKKGVAAPPNPNVPLMVTLPVWTTPGKTTLTATNLPSGYLSVDARLYMIANGAAFPASDDPRSGTIAGGTGETFATATGFADAYQSFVHTVDDTVGRVESSILRRESTTAPDTVTLPNFDFTSALPNNPAAAVDTTTAARPIVKLTSDKPLTAVDGGLVVLSWSTASVTAPITGTWTFVVPASAAATFKAPALPGDSDALTFTPTGPVSVDRATFFEATQLPGYKETKAIPISPRFTFDLLDDSVPLPVNGTVRVTTWSPQLL